jgi:5-deoxy-5-amino-3-dehydroquinate synthase
MHRVARVETRAVITVPVQLGPRSYDVVVGAGARHRLPEVLPPTVGRVAVVTQAGIGVNVDPGVDHRVLIVPDGEAAKSMATVEELCRSFAQAGLARSDAVVAVGGGVVTDLVGFAAASYHRGIAYINVATTLLAQVDAAIGGKTGVNLPEGKNLVGAFWQPKAVLCDTETLITLPAREWTSGRGEMAKYAFLVNLADSASPGGLSPGLSIPHDPEAWCQPDVPVDELVAWCAAIKAAVVSSDEHEGGRRMALNYGHTLAHALEAAAFGPDARWDLRHGEAVGIGLVFAALLARRLDRIDDDRLASHRAVVSTLGLPSRLPVAVDPEELLLFMGRDKKAHHDLTFVLDGPVGVEPVADVDRAEVLAALADLESER